MPDQPSSGVSVRKGATQAAFNADFAGVLMFEILLIAIAGGCWERSWWWFGGTLVGLMIVVQIKPLAILLAILLSVSWGAIGYGLGTLFSQNASVVLGILGLLSGFGAHLSAIQWAQDVASD